MHDGSCTVDFAGAGKCVIKPYTFSVFSQDTLNKTDVGTPKDPRPS